MNAGVPISSIKHANNKNVENKTNNTHRHNITTSDDKENDGLASRTQCPHCASFERFRV